MADLQLHPVNRIHLDALTGPLGIWQHADGPNPNLAFGYCTDDVARALLVDLLHARELGWDAVRVSAWRSLRFLREAFNPATGSFRNFRSREGAWLDDVGSEDSQGRAMLTLGLALAEAPADAATEARDLFLRALPATSRVTALRAASSVLLGCCAAIEAAPAEDVQPTFERLASQLRRAFAPAEHDAGWPWPEPVFTYENALLPRALLAASARLGDVELGRTGRRVLDWLVRVQTAPDGSFAPIGNRGWWPRGEARARFDQQPIEATSLLLAAEAAYRTTGRERYLRVAETAYGWFLGSNTLGVPVADPATGACHDGLTPRGVNANQGAESTLMWLIAVEHMRDLRAARPAIAGNRVDVSVPLMAGARA